MDWHAERKWLIHGTTHNEDRQLLGLEHPCCVSWLKKMTRRNSMVISLIQYFKTKSSNENIPGTWVIDVREIY